MKLSKKTIFTAVYWAISCAMMIFTNLDLAIEGLHTEDKLIALLALPMIGVFLGLQILFHWIFYVSIRNLSFGEGGSTGKNVLHFILAFASGVALLLVYSFWLGLF